MILFFGEILSLTVAISWTATALAADEASKRLGSLTVNVIRMLLSLLMLALTLWIFSGSPYPLYADAKTWFWLALSGFVGYVFGDYCLFNSYVIIGSRSGQLFMTLSPLVAAVAGWAFLGEDLGLKSIAAMAVTLSGIAISIITRNSGSGKFTLKLPLKGILFGIGAGIGQGGGLVLSKIGLNAYEACVPADAPASFQAMMPFASTFIRAVIGGIGFIALMAMTKSFGKLRAGLKDRRAMSLVTIATITGPFIGVSLSLMAVQYTQAGIASTLMALTPAFIILPYSLIYKQKISFKEVIGTVVSLVGVAMFFL